MSISELHERFRNESVILKNVTKQTERFYYFGLHTLLKFKEYQHISQVDESELMAYFTWGRNEKAWSPHTMNVRYKALNVFFKWCIQKQIINQNPLQNVPKPRLPKTAPKSLTKDQALAIYEYVQFLPLPEYYKHPMYQKRFEVAIIATYLFTGIRLSELLNLREEHVNLDEKLITVVEGKGMKDRVVPVPFELERVLRNYACEKEKICLYSVKEPKSTPVPFLTPGLKSHSMATDH